MLDRLPILNKTMATIETTEQEQKAGSIGLPPLIGLRITDAAFAAQVCGVKLRPVQCDGKDYAIADTETKMLNRMNIKIWYGVVIDAFPD